MTGIQRYSPVTFRSGVQETEIRDNWNIVLTYQEEGPGPWLVDLSHQPRWDFQDERIDDSSTVGLHVPTGPGECSYLKNRLINRMNRTQAAIWHLGVEKTAPPDIKGFTDVTEATVFLALFGPETFHITEKLTALDFMNPDLKAPFLLQGPFCHVPCQIVTLEKTPDMSGGLLMAFSRGYADSMIHALLDCGKTFGLRPAGEKRFAEWIQRLQRPAD
jgi:hypothetical protein